MNPDTRAVRIADPDAVFHKGDCFALEVTANRDTALFIFHTGPDGKTRPLLPSEEMKDESNAASAGVPVRVPRQYCFQLDEQRGVETLLVAVTDRPAPRATADEVRQWRLELLRSRGIISQKVEGALGGEPVQSVYHALSEQSPGRLVLEIKIRHE